ncbi:MAG: RIP metalloprotease RseP [Chitinophagales bacterium]|nr:RIP metalloprotease RseP [Chitinophagaceae bacterium]MCB9063846.1 RIP metalloprotease RseP [Chitinophagales bacterium]
MSGGAVQALQLLAALSLLILLHEFGHFFFARLFKTRVEKFYLFFDFLFPFPNILNFSLFKKKKGDTEYGIGWFPLGGYVKIAGMVDESMDKEAMKQPPQPWEYRSKKAWQRLLIMLGGIIMNVVTAMAIYALIFGVWGEQYLPTDNAKYGIAVDSLGESIGLRDGDMIVSIDGNKIERFGKIVPEIILGQAKTIQVSRNGEAVEVPIPEGTIKKLIKKNKASFIDPRIPLVVDVVTKKSEAERMGLAKGDSVIAVNGQPIIYYDEFEDIKRANAEQPITVSVVREGAVKELTGTVPDTKILGFAPVTEFSKYFETETIKYGFFQAIGKGFTYTFDQIGSYWRQLKLLFTSKEVKASESLGGFVSFGKLFAPVFDWQAFLILTAFVSIILAVMNLLPIPGLDGGYVLFLLFELISGKKVSDSVMEKATTVGLVLLLGLMLYANGLDIMRLFQN